MTTFTGRRFWPLDPRQEDVAIEDIAHHLAFQCRFAGATREFYSTAQHSVLVSMVCAKPPCHWPGAPERCDHSGPGGFMGHACGHAPVNALWGLLHDASEAYCSDLVSPLKRGLDAADGYRRAEQVIQAAVCAAFGLPLQEPAPVKIADRLLCKTEQRDLVNLPSDHKRSGPVLRAVIAPWSPAQAERAFLDRFRLLTSKVSE
jgi:hypothetical protein